MTPLFTGLYYVYYTPLSGWRHVGVMSTVRSSGHAATLRRRAPRLETQVSETAECAARRREEGAGQHCNHELWHI